MVGLPVIEVLVLIAVLFVSLFTLYKLRKAHLMLFHLGDDIRTLGDQIRKLPQRDSVESGFRQLEALHRLYLELKLDRALPTTVPTTRNSWAAAPDFLLEVFLHVRERAPQSVLECGCGASSIVIARALKLNGSGHLYSLEHVQAFAAKTRAELQKQGLSEWATILDAPLRNYSLRGEEWPWYSLDGLPDIDVDVLVVDGPPGDVRQLARYPAGPLLFQRLKSPCAVFVDDMIRADEQKAVEDWLREFPDFRSQNRDCAKGCAVLTR